MKDHTASLFPKVFAPSVPGGQAAIAHYNAVLEDFLHFQWFVVYSSYFSFAEQPIRMHKNCFSSHLLLLTVDVDVVVVSLSCPDS